MMTNAGTKRIFISDIHMGDERSQAGPNPYGWFRKNIPHLANFLNEQLNAQEVAEVVILGDLFDEWVIPTEQDPLTSFRDICNNPSNSPLIDGLRQLAARGILTYVPGNHDMTLSTTDPEGNQNFMQQNFPGIRYQADGVYRRGRLVAEHGHCYCLFNAPGKWTKLPSLLPLGYFLARMGAYKVSKTGIKKDYYDILRDSIKQYRERPTFVEDRFVKEVYEEVAHFAGLKDTDTIDMSGIDGFPTDSVGDIGSLYERLINEWKEKRKDLKWEIALVGDGARELYPAAGHIYSNKGFNIVIFGHTHNWSLELLLFPHAAPEAQVTRFALTFPAIYANSGAWIDKAPCCTYVETWEDAAAGRHYVRVLNYPAKKMLGERSVKL